MSVFIEIYVYISSRLFHSFWAESIARSAKSDILEKNHLSTQAELGLSHMWPELGSNPQWCDDERFRALKISVLNHSATGGYVS